MSESPQALYERLLTLGVCELELARAGRLEELAACQYARAEIMRALPGTPPPEVRRVLEQCLVIERHLEAELRSARGAVLDALAEVRHAQRAAAGYTPVRERLRLVNADA
ncbi:MAG TPA: hypothetical protein VE992_03945 [Solirubrobacteraceae bacterium]|nr:hypothetical protein [Solirubrobacteraceae bacterium]